MEGAPSAKVFTGFRFGRWKKQSGYKRINAAADAEPRKKRRFWKLSPRIKLRLNFRLRFSPKKFLIRLRDAYVNMMLRIGNAPGIGAFAGDGVAGFGPRRFKEYDEKMLVQIYYKSLLMAQTPRDGNCCLPEVTIKERTISPAL